jgi:glutamine amidotransferase
MIVIVDYGMGNSGSIRNMMVKVGANCTISSDLNEIARADKLVLPGVGSFDRAVTRLQESGILEILNRRVIQDKVPILGICLGMQLFTCGSEEGRLGGLGWVQAETLKFKGLPAGLKIPHMGWNQIRQCTNHSAIDEIDSQARFYFVHSYYVKCMKEENVVASTTYGVEFHSIISQRNVFGVQFHPEKSHKYGMQLMSWFARGKI